MAVVGYFAGNVRWIQASAVSVAGPQSASSSSSSKATLCVQHRADNKNDDGTRVNLMVGSIGGGMAGTGNICRDA